MQCDVSFHQGSGNVDPSGNFSIQVLRAALTNAYGLSLPNIQQQGALGNHDVTDVNVSRVDACSPGLAISACRSVRQRLPTHRSQI